MRTVLGGMVIILSASLAGCNLAQAVAQPTAVPPTPFAAPATLNPVEVVTPEEPALVPTQALPVEEPSPEATETTALTELLVGPLAEAVICRFGPGEVYSVEAKISPGEQVTAHGRDAEAAWLEVDNPARQGRLCWARRAELAGAEAAEALPVAPLPSNIVTRVTVDVDPTKETIACSELPFTYKVTYTVTTTGPLAVRLEGVSSEGQAMKAKTVNLDKAGTFSFSEKLKVTDAGEHWYRVNVLAPNAISGEGKAKLTCTP